MSLKQLSVFVSNTKGRIADLTEILAEANVDIRAFSVADTTDFGILRLIVDNQDDAVQVLQDNNIAYSLTDVIIISIDDTPGAFSKIMRMLANKDVQLEYMYAFISRDPNKAMVVLRVDLMDVAIKALKEEGISIFEEDSFC